jgi:hypothetical protein
MRNIEALFVVVPIVALGAFGFSVLDAAKQLGPTLQGQIRQCTGGRGRTGGPRNCTVDLGSDTTIQVDVPYGRAGDLVRVAKMHKSLSGLTYYAAKASGEP